MLETRGDSVGDSLRLPPRGPSFVTWGWTSEPAVLGAGSSQPGHISSGHRGPVQQGSARVTLSSADPRPRIRS